MQLRNLTESQLSCIFESVGYFSKVLEESEQSIKIELSVNPYEYDNEFLVFDNEGGKSPGFYYGILHDVLNLLKSNRVVISWYMKKSNENTWLELPEEDKTQFINSYKNSYEGIEGIIPILNKEVGDYVIVYDISKYKLLRNILSQKIKYISKLKTLRFLETIVKHRIEYDEFLDYMDIEEMYVFSDWKTQILSIASSNRRNVAKMYYYFFGHMNEEEQDHFIKACLEFETEVVSSRNFNFDENTHTEGIGIFFYDPKKDSEFQKNAIIPKRIEGNISYDFDTQLLTIGDRYIPFKGAKDQRHLIEFLINNSNRFITGTETGNNIKQLLADIKKKMKAKGVSQLEMKKIFIYFTQDKEEFCRILL